LLIGERSGSCRGVVTWHMKRMREKTYGQRYGPYRAAATLVVSSDWTSNRTVHQPICLFTTNVPALSGVWQELLPLLLRNSTHRVSTVYRGDESYTVLP
jgi:hypothetical protein